MRILVFGNQALALVNFRAPLMQDMKARGHDVYALAPGFTSELRAQLKVIGVQALEAPLSRTGINPLRDLSDIAGLWCIIRRLRPHAVLAFTIKPVIYGTIVAAIAGVPKRFALITGLGYVFSEGGSVRDRAVKTLARALYWLAARHAHSIFVQNSDDAKELVTRRLVLSSKVSLVNGTGVDLVSWPAMPVPSGRVTFTLAARLLGEKGIREFVSAARRVKSTHPNTRFLILGGLDSNPSAIPEVEVRSWVAEGIVEWPGHVPMRPWLAQTSVYVLPSYREGVPRSTQEAMASGRPVITTDVPGCRETVIDGENGYLVRARDAEALADAMLRFVERPEIIEKMGLRSRTLAEERFDVRRINAVMLSVMGA